MLLFTFNLVQLLFSAGGYQEAMLFLVFSMFHGFLELIATMLHGLESGLLSSVQLRSIWNMWKTRQKMEQPVSRSISNRRPFDNVQSQTAGADDCYSDNSCCWRSRMVQLLEWIAFQFRVRSAVNTQGSKSPKLNTSAKLDAVPSSFLGESL